MAKTNGTVVTAFLLLSTLFAGAQNVGLPDFKVEEAGKNRTLVSWVNQYGDQLIQMNVQVSYDSLRNFGTVFDPLSPGLQQNGFVDGKIYYRKVFYRLFYVLAGNTYFFTASKAAGDVGAVVNVTAENKPAYNTPLVPAKDKYITVRSPIAVLANLSPSDYARFRDSIANKTKDTLLTLSPMEIEIKRYVPVVVNPLIGAITLNAEGFVEIKLPNIKLKKYKIVFLDSNGGHIFTVSHVNDTDLVLDKTNFLHAGWFSFEIYEDDKVAYKDKIYLQSEF
jgi:hypothetical protein